MRTAPLRTINVPDELSEQHVECTVCGTTADYAEQLKGHVHATAVTDEELALEQALERIQYELETQIEVEQASNHTDAWTPDYTEGFIDGLKRALELMPEAISPEEGTR